MKALLLRLHRWVALAFALPLLLVLGTGLILSVEPIMVERGIVPGSLDAAKVQAILAKHDPQGQARAITFRSYEQGMTISAGRSGGTTVDVRTAAAVPQGGMSQFMVTMRRMHENLLLEAGWLVIASTVAMLVLALLGVLMGLPRFSNTLAGWHKGMAWGLLPLVVLSPLTGLFLAMGISFTSPPVIDKSGAAQNLRDAVRIVGEKHDLSSLVWLRPQGGRTMVRLVEGGEFKVFVVTPQGTVQTQRNWPRLWHEGNFAGSLSALLNVVTSFALIGLLFTGIWIWASRTLRLRARRTVRVVTT